MGSGPHRRNEAYTAGTTMRREPTTQQALGEEASRRSPRRWTTRLVPEGHPAEANEHWTISSMPNVHTTRTCATSSGTAETSSTPSGTADLSNLCHLPHHEEDPKNLDNPSSRKGEEAEHSHASTEKSTSSSADTDRKKTRGSRSSTIVRYWWRPPVLPPCIDGPNTRSPSLGRISGSTSIIRANTRSSSI
jgi:hypothetical protein